MKIPLIAVTIPIEPTIPNPADGEVLASYFRHVLQSKLGTFHHMPVTRNTRSAINNEISSILHLLWDLYYLEDHEIPKPDAGGIIQMDTIERLIQKDREYGMGPEGYWIGYEEVSRAEFLLWVRLDALRHRHEKFPNNVEIDFIDNEGEPFLFDGNWLRIIKDGKLQ